MDQPTELIDHGTHMTDPATGNNYAKTMTGKEKRVKHRRMIRPADSELLFGLYLEYKRGNIRQVHIADATGWSDSTLSEHFKKMGFAEKAARVLKATDKMKPEMTAESAATNLAARLKSGNDEHVDAVEELMLNARKHFRRMRGGAILKNAKNLKTVVDIGRDHYGMNAEAQKAQVAAPVLNVAFLMGMGSEVSVSTSTGNGSLQP